MRKAEPEDIATVLNILLESFKNDPYMNWLSKRRFQCDDIIIYFMRR
jgi:hypothetical protein